MSEERLPLGVRIMEVVLIISLFSLAAWFIRPFVFKVRPVFSIPGLLECEDLRVKAKSPDLFLKAESTKNFSTGVWSRNQQLFGMAYGPHNWAEFLTEVTVPGKYEINGYFTTGPQYAALQFFLDGKEIGAPIDLSSKDSAVSNTGKINLGTRDLEQGAHILRIEILNGNAENSSGHLLFGIDGFTFNKI